MVKRFGAVQTERWVWTHFAHLSGQSPGDRSTDSPKWIINQQYANPHKWSFDCDFPTSYTGQIRGNGITFVSYMYMQKDYREQCYYPVMFQRSIVTGCVLICQGKLPSDCPLEGPDHHKDMQTQVVWTCLPFIRSGQNCPARHSERGKKKGRQKKRREDNIREWTGLEFAES